MSDQYVTVDLHIWANSIAELRDKLEHALAGFAPVVVLPEAASIGPEPVLAQPEAPQEAPAEAEKPKRARKAKDAPVGEPAGTVAADSAEQPDPASATSAQPATASPSSTDTAGSSPGVTHEQAKASAEAFMANHPDGKDQAKKEIRGYLATYGVSRVAELAAKDLQSFLSDLEGV